MRLLWIEKTKQEPPNKWIIKQPSTFTLAQMTRLKLSYIRYFMQRPISLEKVGKVKGKRKPQPTAKWMDTVTVMPAKRIS